MDFLFGCAIWAYKGWVGELYPRGTRPDNFLYLYSRRFTAVEGNTTFYAIPSTKIITNWVSQTPPGFQFCLKLPREITHNGLLEPQISSALNFVQRMTIMGKHLGPMFAQLPPSYSPQYLGDLTKFLTNWQTDITYLALEVRHPDWFREPHASNLTELLTKLNIARVLLDTRPIYSGYKYPKMDSERRKPKLPLVFQTTATFTLIRFISHPTMEINQPFMKEWLNYIQQWLHQGKRIYFFVHCPAEEQSPHTAYYFYKLLHETGINIPYLKWNQTQQTPQQLSLW
ncbi:COG1801: Uncharacterized conserved protein [Richelia intracellularis HH01]|jgi:uncharacterized protein YecE (DUF72 family)|uniref:COG1801: Uncharacterized conserved protein n=1 Tax=Richelia intracellularis HH01 TaxID=1165094 RepID=M1WYW4_9NOST|nr:DUF72 domain-containing protein [Richelia intracellularis]CCH66253.1 COG1801: Uncharacterized conserved protein [Richelia intracellularis HH01]